MDFNEDLKKTPSKKMTSSPRPFTRIFGTALATCLRVRFHRTVAVRTPCVDLSSVRERRLGEEQVGVEHGFRDARLEVVEGVGVADDER